MNPASERKALDYYLSKKYPFVVYPSEDGGYSAEVTDLPGCLTEGENLEELAAHVEEARRAWLEVAYEEGVDIPLPRNEALYSGRFVVRLPKYLHRRLAEESEKEGVSLNQLVMSLLSGRLSERETIVAVKRAVQDALSSGTAGLSSEQEHPYTWQAPRGTEPKPPRKGNSDIHLLEEEEVAA